MEIPTEGSGVRVCVWGAGTDCSSVSTLVTTVIPTTPKYEWRLECSFDASDLILAEA